MAKWEREAPGGRVFGMCCRAERRQEGHEGAKHRAGEEVLKAAAAHAAKAHALIKIDEPMMVKVKAAIRTV